MFWPANTSFWSLLPRRACALVSLLAYLAVTIGLPLPGRSGKDHSVPFPCQDNPCGCQTAEECWRHCCCNTPEQRLAWARAHGVTPPNYAVLKPGQGWDTRQPTKPTQPKCALCAVADAAQTERTAAGCCSKQDQVTKPASEDKAKPWRWQLGSASFKCRGMSLFWLQGGSGSLPPPVLTWLPSFPLVDCLLDGSTQPLRLPLIPPTPPPRITI